MKLDALDHPKTLDFASRLNVSRPTAIGHLELFWHFVSKHAPRGNIGKFPDGAIARACEWTGEAPEFIAALVDSGFVDPSYSHRFLVHDWTEHCPNWVRAQLKKLGQPFILATDEPPPVPTYEHAPVPSTRGRVPSQAIPREAKGRDLQDRREREGGFESQSPPSDANDLVEQLQRVYPAGTYRAASWLKAAHFVARLLDDGVSEHELLEAATAYGIQQHAKGKLGTDFILSPAKFFESEWRGPFPVSAPTAASATVDRTTWRPTE